MTHNMKCKKCGEGISSIFIYSLNKNRVQQLMKVDDYFYCQKCKKIIETTQVML